MFSAQLAFARTNKTNCSIHGRNSEIDAIERNLETKSVHLVYFQRELVRLLVQVHRSFDKIFFGNQIPHLAPV